MEQQNLSKIVEENWERIDFLEKTLAVERRQQQRLSQISIEKEREREKARSAELLEGGSSSYTSSATLELEERNRKELVDAMLNSSSSNVPIVKNICNIQGKLTINTYFFLIWN